MGWMGGEGSVCPVLRATIVRTGLGHGQLVLVFQVVGS